MSKELEKIIEDTKQAFSEYFELISGKKFKQFYYDWHVDNMLAPFAGITEYFSIHNSKQAKEKFHNFVQDAASGLESYDVDKPSLSYITSQKHSSSNDGKFSHLIKGIETFGFEFRQFIYSFGTKEDHSTEFGYWPIKTNMPYSAKHGLLVAKDILEFMDKNADTIFSSHDVYRAALNLSDSYLRQSIAKTYAYKDNYSFVNRKNAIKKLHDLRNNLSKEFNQRKSYSPQLADMFQIEQISSTKTDHIYWPNGFELEFYVPEQYSDYHILVEHLKNVNHWEKLYLTNSDTQVYKDKASAGVIMRDESLAPYEGLFPVEFASRIMTSKEDEAQCLKIMDAFPKGHVNKHCSLHQHLSSEGFDIDTYKRLIKRVMQHEEEIVGNFAAPERRDNNLLYATYISRNLSSQRKRDYPFLAIMVDLCDNKTELEEMVSFGNKYKTLNIMPTHTIEMRAMNANFNKKFVEAYLQFNRDLVVAAIQNNPQHLNRVLLNKYNWYNNESSDEKTVMHDLNYGYDFAPHDSYRPLKVQVSPQLVGEEQEYARVVAQALETTGKLHYNNSSARKMRGTANNAK